MTRTEVDKITTNKYWGIRDSAVTLYTVFMLVQEHDEHSATPCSFVVRPRGSRESGRWRTNKHNTPIPRYLSRPPVTYLDSLGK